MTSPSHRRRGYSRDHTRSDVPAGIEPFYCDAHRLPTGPGRRCDRCGHQWLRRWQIEHADELRRSP